MNLAPNMPELMPQNPQYWGWNRVQFTELSTSEKAELQRLGAGYFSHFEPEELAIYRTPKGLTFLTPLEFMGI